MAERRRTIVMGTRGSALALVQTGLVVERLRALQPGLAVETRVIKTSGDRGAVEAVGAFVKELEEALLHGEVDLAVHSLKDMPTALPAGLALAAVLERADPRDALVVRAGAGAGAGAAHTLDALPAGARVGTGSPRRTALLLAARPDLAPTPIQGNVDTRLRKLDAGDFDALVLAAAGLERLGLGGRIAERIALERMLPDAGQGALALEVRAGDARACELVRPLDDPATHAAVAAERAFLAVLGGGCRVPIGACGRIEGGSLVLRGLVASLDGRTVLRDGVEAPFDGRLATAERAGRDLGERLLGAGARALVEACPP